MRDYYYILSDEKDFLNICCFSCFYIFFLIHEPLTINRLLTDNPSPFLWEAKQSDYDATKQGIKPKLKKGVSFFMENLE